MATILWCQHLKVRINISIIHENKHLCDKVLHAAHCYDITGGNTVSPLSSRGLAPATSPAAASATRGPVLNS